MPYKKEMDHEYSVAGDTSSSSHNTLTMLLPCLLRKSSSSVLKWHFSSSEVELSILKAKQEECAV